MASQNGARDRDLAQDRDLAAELAAFVAAAA